MQLSEQRLSKVQFFRYPGITIEPTESEFAQAILAATDIYEFALSILPVDVLPEI